MSESSPENPFASPQAPIFVIEETPDPPGDGPFYFEDAWIGGRTPLSLSRECLLCGKDAADNQRRVRGYRHRDRKQYPSGCKISYSVCNPCGARIDFWRCCSRLFFGMFSLAVVCSAVGFAGLYFQGLIDPNKLIFLGFLIGSILTIGITFLAAGISDSLQPLRMQAIKDEGDRTYVVLPNQEFHRAISERAARRVRDGKEIR